jgi:putative transposase
VSLRAAAKYLVESHHAGQRKACELVGVARSSFRYRSRKRDDELRQSLVRLGQEQPRYGYRRLAVLLEREGQKVNHKRVWRLYRAAGLSVKRKRRKRLTRLGAPVSEPLTAVNQQWAIDFVHDVTATGRKFRIFSVVDAYSRECLALEVDTSFPSGRVTRVLDQVIAVRGKAQSIRLDNGPELTSRHFLAWGIAQRIELRHIEPGKPVQNAKVESFNGRLRDECLNVSWFATLWHARQMIGAWRLAYNTERPHSSLGYLTPAEFAAQLQLESGPAVAAAEAAVKGLRATQTAESRSDELRELEPQLAPPLTAAFAAAGESTRS